MSPWTPKMFKFPSSFTVTKASFRRCLPQTEGILFLPIRPLLPFGFGLVFVHLYLKKSLSSLGCFLFPIFTILPSFPSCPHLFIPFSLFVWQWFPLLLVLPLSPYPYPCYWVLLQCIDLHWHIITTQNLVYIRFTRCCTSYVFGRICKQISRRQFCEIKREFILIWFANEGT